MPSLDAHVHVWSDDLATWPIAAGYQPAEMIPARFTAEDLFAHCRPLGVERIVLVQMSYYGTDNSYMLETMRRYPGVFGGIAVVDESADDLEAQMAHLRSLGVRGFRVVQPDEVAEGWLSTPGHERLFREAAQLGQAVCCLANPRGIGEVARTCERFPDTPVVIDHFCRIGLEGVIREEDVAALLTLARYSQVHVKVSAFYALGQGLPHHDLTPMVEPVLEAFGARRLLWGSDCPYQVQEETYEDGMRVLQEVLARRPVAEPEWIWGKTAEGLFF